MTVHQLNFVHSGTKISAAGSFDSGPNYKNLACYKDKALKELSNDTKHKGFSCCQSWENWYWCWYIEKFRKCDFLSSKTVVKAVTQKIRKNHNIIFSFDFSKIRSWNVVSNRAIILYRFLILANEASFVNKEKQGI